MKAKKYILLVVFTALAILPMFGQLRSAYFLERMPYRTRLNPALINDRGYFAIPFLGNIGVTTASNLGISDVLYPSLTNANELNLFLHPSVSASDFLNGLNKNNKVRANLEITLLSAGFFAFGGYNTVDLALRSQNRINVPKSLFQFLKEGAGTTGRADYSIKDLRASSSTYIELGFSHARYIMDNLTVGAKVKVLFGAADFDLTFDHMDLSLTGNRWNVRSQGRFAGSVKGATFKYDSDGYVDGFDFDSPGLGGVGAAIDLGATYEPIENLVVSAAITDLGLISWSNTLQGVTPYTEYTFAGVPELDKDDAFDAEMDRLEETFENMAKIKNDGTSSSRTTWLNATMNIGAEYKLLKNKISFGLLSSTHFDRGGAWHELMAAANFRPASWFQAALSGSVSDYGVGWGVVLNLCPGGFNIFLASDLIISEVIPTYYAPTGNLNANVQLGMNIPLGRNNLRKK